MKIVADEGVDKPIVDLLRGLGFEVFYILEEKSGIIDEEVLRIANENKAILITMDTDFGELVFRLKEASNGVVMFRISGLTKSEKLTIVTSTFRNHHQELMNNFTVVTKDTIRIRQLPNS